MPLSGEEQLNIRDVLRSAYVTPSSFKELLLGINQEWDDLSSDKDEYPARILSVVRYANARGWLPELITRARADIPSDPILLRVEAQLSAEANLHAVELRRVAADSVICPSYELREEFRGVPGVHGLSHGKMGSIHLHVDGGAHAHVLILNLLKQHREEDYVCDINQVDLFVPGPQRTKEWEETYKVHTPGHVEEELTFFSTTRLFDGPCVPNRKQWAQIRAKTRDALTSMHHHSSGGLVVELERVVGSVDANGSVTMATPLALPSLELHHIFEPNSILFKPPGNAMQQTMYELHISVDFPRTPEKPPVDLNAMLDVSKRAGSAVGGWFLFYATDRWAYRSNGFTTQLSEDGLKEKWSRFRQALSAVVAADKSEFSLKLLAEESLGVWKSPLQKYVESVRTVRDLADWEQNISEDGQFWVIAPNFLGDQDDRVRAAMLVNFGKRIKYTYFLKSSADARRWLEFKAEMVQSSAEAKDLMQAIVISFAKWERLRDRFAFIANPGTSQQQAMLLKVDEFSQRIYAGSPMSVDEGEKVVNMLKPLVDAEQVREWRQVVGTRGLQTMAVVHIRYAADAAERTGDQFDKDLAIAISRFQGEVFASDARTVVLGFEGSPEAVSRAIRFMRKLRAARPEESASNISTVAIDYGGVQRAIRSFGMQWEGEAVEGARKTLSLAAERPGIFLSARAADGLRSYEILPSSDLEQIGAELYLMTRG
jgi:effector-associated domain 1 (EAD1)-containing protein